MTFSEALGQLKQGKKVARKNWNGKDQFIFMIDGDDLKGMLLIAGAKDHFGAGEWEQDILLDTLFDGEGSDLSNLLAIKTTSNQIQLGWLASQTDMLSDDWEVVE